MSEINQPREVISDEDIGHLPEALYEKYDFEEELEEDELLEQDQTETAIVENYDNYINMSQLNNDLASSANTTSYKPAQVIRVLNKTSRTLSSGQVILDYELEIQGVDDATSYEVRVLQQ